MPAEKSLPDWNGKRNMSTLNDVAQKAGVSKTLVSRVINNQKGVSPQNRKKIREAIKELDY